MTVTSQICIAPKPYLDTGTPGFPYGLPIGGDLPALNPKDANSSLFQHLTETRLQSKPEKRILRGSGDNPLDELMVVSA
jgi:hypothetical protein